MNKLNKKYFAAAIIMDIILIIAGIFLVFYLIVFIHSNSLADLITSLLLAALGFYFLYNRIKRRKQRRLQNNQARV